MDTPGPSPAPVLILVHGSWHDGSAWSAVQEQLAARGVRSIAPTLPGHGAGDDARSVRHDDYVATVVAVLDELAQPAILVGHSFGGSVISRAAELRPGDCHGLIYYSAFVPGDGERVADSLPHDFIEFIERAAATGADYTIELPDYLLRDSFANTADEETVERIRRLLIPEPCGPIFETLSLPSFPHPDIPTVYVTCSEDRAMPPGTFHPRQSGRLRDPRLIEVHGDHECLLTAPGRLVDALDAARDAIDRQRGSCDGHDSEVAADASPAGSADEHQCPSGPHLARSVAAGRSGFNSAVFAGVRSWAARCYRTGSGR